MTITPKDYPLRGGNRQLLTVALFVEPWQVGDPGGYTPVFSLLGREGYIDARNTFLSERDPTGVKWADKYLEGVNHLLRLLKCSWFADAWDDWQLELEAILQSEAIETIKSISQGGGPAAFQAAKFIAGKEWKKSGRGRPSKSEVSTALRREVEKTGQHEADFERIQLKVIK